MSKSILRVNSFFPEAKPMRAHFERRFKNPKAETDSSERFCWDYWNVPGQYTLLRTPAYHFFPKPLYRRFHEQLVWWGRSVLGCHDISPPWLSCYVEGCEQNWHGDLPHGPWAFVYSLTPWETRKFLGGETTLLKEEVLDLWDGLSQYRGMEQEDIIEKIPPKFNQLTVFDPRIPHGVERVRGVQNVLDGRLVIHGWFVQPRPFIQGPLDKKEVQDYIEAISAYLSAGLAQGEEISGVLSYGIEIGANGSVGKITELTQNLRSRDKGWVREVRQAIAQFTKQTKFSKKNKPSRLTLPLIFEGFSP